METRMLEEIGSVEMATDSGIDTDTVVIGGSAAGLAVAACLKRAGVDVVVIERTDVVGTAWRNHYDRLHLHTTRNLSGLPYLPMPKSYPKYPGRDQVVEYLESYAAHFGIEPAFGQEVESVVKSGTVWETRTADRVWRSNRVVIATGYTRVPTIPSWPGAETFSGPIIHSSEYSSGKDLTGKRVLVVGFGNSAGEIALDLLEHGAQPTLAVRGPVNVVPRDLLGIPILTWGIALRVLPAKLADLMAAPLLRLTMGDIRKTGLKKLPYGANAEIRHHGQIPLLDIGTMKQIRNGSIGIRPGIDRFSNDAIVFDDGSSEPFDAVVLATGYRPGLADFVAETVGVLNEDGAPARSGAETDCPGLYLCGFHVAATGMLREIAIEAKRVASDIETQVARASR